MEFIVELSKEADKALSKNKSLMKETMKKFYEYAQDPYKHRNDVVKMEGKKNLFRMKINPDYRALFTIRAEVITIYILFVGSRGDIYNKLRNL